MEKKAFYQFLLERYANGSASDEEVQELFAELEKREDGADWEEMIDLFIRNTERAEHYEEAYWHPAIQRILATQQETAPVRKLYPKRWLVAASIILLLGAAVTAYLLNSTLKKDATKTVVQENKEPVPGRQGAVLTLADNSQVLLDTIKDGVVVALQGGASAKVVNGNLVYDSKGSAVVYNTIATPKGRQYRVTLPDGTNVWLNAGSSIRYPTAFVEGERRVTISGEAYLEVAPVRLRTGQKMPFRVNLNNKTEVLVLGTHFNVNAYVDEPAVKTTLLEGKVKVSSMVNGEWSILKPGEQAQVKESIKIINANVEQVIAWKNGLFDFNNKDVRSALREIARWYDLDLVYESEPQIDEIVGKMQMNLTLSQVMATLKDLDINYRIEGRKLIISK